MAGIGSETFMMIDRGKDEAFELAEEVARDAHGRQAGLCMGAGNRLG